MYEQSKDCYKVQTVTQKHVFLIFQDIFSRYCVIDLHVNDTGLELRTKKLPFNSAVLISFKIFKDLLSYLF